MSNYVKKSRTFGKKGWWFALWAPLGLVLGFVVFCNAWITLSTRSRIFDSAGEAPANTVGVVLGTNKNFAPNRPNLHFTRRVEAAAELYRQRKVDHLLVSGATNSAYYNEAADMAGALIELGVPPTAITRDESGFRTLDSVVRAQRVFGQDRYTIITDDFHVSRAVFLARRYRQDAIGFASAHVAAPLSAKSRFREIFARCKAVLDVYVFRTQPRELGDPVLIEVATVKS